MSDYSSPAYVLSVFSIIISIVMSGIALYSIFRVNTLQKQIVYYTNENKGRIGRLIRELNIIHRERREIDASQDDQLSNIMKEDKD